MLPHNLAQLTLKDVREARYTTAVLPIGATEPHNFHLPYATDNFIAGHIAEGATRLANSLGGRCVLLPNIPFGYEGNMRGFPLAINLQPTTLIRIVRDLADTLTESGLDYLFILNGHGGNELKTIVRELNRETEIFICGANWWESVDALRWKLCPDGGDHANDMETAACLHIVPDLVRMDQADEGRMSEPVIDDFAAGWVKYSRPWKEFAPSSGAGDPRNTTAEVGRELLEGAISVIGNFLFKLSTSPRTEGFPFGK